MGRGKEGGGRYGATADVKRGRPVVFKFVHQHDHRSIGPPNLRIPRTLIFYSVTINCAPVNKIAENKARGEEDVGRLGAKLEEHKSPDDHVDFVFIIEIETYRERILKGGQFGAHHFALPVRG